MDSFAELADQFFEHRKNGWGGCCNYSDIVHSDEFRAVFEEKGLLNIEHIESSYRQFIGLIRDKYGRTPIIFLHFPMTLETRSKYLERGKFILKTIDKLALELNGIYSICVDDRIVARPRITTSELADFPYHYNTETYLEFSKLLRKFGKQIDGLSD